MEARFIIFSEEKRKIIDINYKYVDYPYMVYTYKVGDEEMDPLEDINHMDEDSPTDMALDYWTLAKVVKCLSLLSEFISHNAEVLSVHKDWLSNTICSPLENVKIIENIIGDLNKYNADNMIATVAFYEE